MYKIQLKDGGSATVTKANDGYQLVFDLPRALNGGLKIREWRVSGEKLYEFLIKNAVKS